MKARANITLNSWVIFGLWLLLWVGRFWLVPAYFERTSDLGYYPPEADSIGIPIMGNIMMTIVLGPVFGALLWRACKGSPPEGRRWLAWRRERWGASLAWTVFFGLLAGLALSSWTEDARIGLPVNAAADVGWAVFWLAWRAVVVSGLRAKGGVADDAGLEQARS